MTKIMLETNTNKVKLEFEEDVTMVSPRYEIITQFLIALNAVGYAFGMSADELSDIIEEEITKKHVPPFSSEEDDSEYEKDVITRAEGV